MGDELAHDFALGWLPLWLGGRRFGASLLAYNLPHITRWIVTLSMLGIVTSAILAIILLPKKEGGLEANGLFHLFYSMGTHADYAYYFRFISGH